MITNSATFSQEDLVHNGDVHDEDDKDGKDPQNRNGDVVDNSFCCAVMGTEQVNDEQWAKVPDSVSNPDCCDGGEDETFLGDDRNRISEGSDDCCESVDSEEKDVVERAAEEEVGEAPERVEDGVVNEVAFDVVLDGVVVVNSNHDGQPDTAVEQVDHAKALNTDVGHCLQGSLTP